MNDPKKPADAKIEKTIGTASESQDIESPKEPAADPVVEDSAQKEPEHDEVVAAAAQASEAAPEKPQTHTLLDEIHDLTHRMQYWIDHERQHWAVKEIKARIEKLRELL